MHIGTRCNTVMQGCYEYLSMESSSVLLLKLSLKGQAPSILKFLIEYSMCSFSTLILLVRSSSDL